MTRNRPWMLLALLLVAGTALADDAPQRRVVFGSYAQPGNAEAEAQKIRDTLGIEVQLVRVTVDGQDLTRVTSLPMAGDTVWPLTAKAADQQIPYWTWKLPE